MEATSVNTYFFKAKKMTSMMGPSGGGTPPQPESKKVSVSLPWTPVEDWESSFKDLEIKVEKILGKYELKMEVPKLWGFMDVEKDQQYGPISKIYHSRTSPYPCIVITAGNIPEGQSLEDIATSSPRGLMQKGAHIPVVITSGVSRSHNPKVGHTINFAAVVPDHLLMGNHSVRPVPFFKYITVVPLPNKHYLTFETSTAGDGLDPMKELQAMSALHTSFSIKY